MHLTELGWDDFFHHYFPNEAPADCVPARVSQESRGLYRVQAEKGEFLAQVSGQVRFHSTQRSDFPAVGDWTVIEPRAGERWATIHAILPRKTLLSRKIAGKTVAEQILVANVDVVFVVTSINQDFNLRRIERYLAVVWDSGARPVILLNKADLSSDVESFVADLQSVSPGVPMHSLSALTGQGMQQLGRYLRTGQTAVLIGSSGVGKSTIINALTGLELQRVGPVRLSDDRGKHVTTSRQMIFLNDGGILIDTPGLRELQLWDNASGLTLAFTDLETVARRCRFRNCHHRDEPGCAVLLAVQEGTFPKDRLENFRKMEAELNFLQSKIDPAARQRRKAHAKRSCKAFKRNSQKR